MRVNEFISRLKLAPALLALLLSLLLATPAAAIQPHRPAAVPALAQGDRAAAAILPSAELFAVAADPAGDPDPDDADAPAAGRPACPSRPVAASIPSAGGAAFARRLPYRARAPPSA